MSPLKASSGLRLERLGPHTGVEATGIDAVGEIDRFENNGIVVAGAFRGEIAPRAQPREEWIPSKGNSDVYLTWFEMR